MKLSTFDFCLNAQTQETVWEGKRYLVAPVVALKVGVHSGSDGIPTFYPKEELAKFPEAWNGRPVPIEHPVKGGFPVSANDPAIVEAQSVGQLWGVTFENNSLKGQIWLDIDKLNKISPELLSRIKGDNQIEVSTGLFSEMAYIPGTWNGEKYERVIKGIRPDHLALLPDRPGACSWADGCGIRTNQKGELIIMDNEPLVMPELDFGQKKDDPISLVKNHLEGRHGKIAGLQILQKMSAGDVIEMADNIKANKSVEGDELLLVPKLSWD